MTEQEWLTKLEEHRRDYKYTEPIEHIANHYDGNSDCFLAHSATRVYFDIEIEGVILIASVPRHPQKG